MHISNIPAGSTVQRITAGQGRIRGHTLANAAGIYLLTLNCLYILDPPTDRLRCLVHPAAGHHLPAADWETYDPRTYPNAP